MFFVGNVAMLRSLLCLALALSVQTAPGLAKSLALIIGNDNYQNVTPLRKARSDAAGYHQLFATQGFDVSLHTDLSSREMTVELATFFDRIEPGDTVVFVFAGHGWSDGRENFLVPVDIRPSGSETLLSRESFPLRNGANGIIDEIAKRGAGLTLAIIDACRDNPFASDISTRTIGISRGLAPVEAPSGTFVAFSAGAGQTALDRLSDSDAAPYSVFTRHFLTELSKAQDLQAAFKRTQRLVNTDAGKVGHPQRPAYYDEVIGSACLFGSCDGGAKLALPQTAPQPAPQASKTDLHAEAAQTWTAFQNSNSVDALELFAERYAGTAYAALAQERMAALSAPKPQPAPVPQQRVYVPRPGWCPNASTQTEIAICSDDTLAQYDQQINAAYAYWKGVLNGSAERQFDVAQKQWLRYRDSCRGDRNCIGNAYRSRLAEIRF